MVFFENLSFLSITQDLDPPTITLSQKWIQSLGTFIFQTNGVYEAGCKQSYSNG